MGNRYRPKRYATVLLHLTGTGDVVEDGVHRTSARRGGGLRGGSTTFPCAVTAEFHDSDTVAPRSGNAVLFYNALPDGNMDDSSQHAGDRVERGVTYLANVWFWDPILN